MFESFADNSYPDPVKPKVSAHEDEDSDDGTDEILDDIQEALTVARLQGKIAPVRIARILAGEGTEQFSAHSPYEMTTSARQQTVPLSVALEYVGAILDDSRREISRLKVQLMSAHLISPLLVILTYAMRP